VLKVLQTKRTLDKPILVYIITSGAADAAYDSRHLATVIQVRSQPRLRVVAREYDFGAPFLTMEQGLQQMMSDFRMPPQCISIQFLQVLWPLKNSDAQASLLSL
jgi:hypothetical protein